MTADTSAVVAALAAWHEAHDFAARALEPVHALPSHVLVETYSVLTRLPSGLAVAPDVATSALRRRFGDAPLRLDAAQTAAVLETLAGARVLGGAAYDGLVALEAKAHGEELLTLDTRAQSTYQRLAVPFRVIAVG